ncbi:MAG: 6,7-dimethyl-8-ribityllumazine synthase [Alphaproteobacteria bacterium]
MTKILIVEAPYYEDVSENLAKGAITALENAGCDFERLEVPGALEIPLAIKLAFESGRYDGFIALGCVIRGETTHYDIVCNESARGLTMLALEHNIAIGNGILTCENQDQALVRAKPELKNKGGDAAKAVLRLLDIQKQFKK